MRHQVAQNGFVPNSLADVGVHCRKRVIQEVNVGVVVQRPGQRYASTLPAGQRDAPSANLRLVASGENVEVRKQTADVDDVVIFFFVIRLVKADVLLDRGREDWRVLRAICNTSTQANENFTVVAELV